MEDPFHYWDHSFWRIMPSSVKDQISKADIDVSRIRPYYIQLVILLAIVLHDGSYQGFY